MGTPTWQPPVLEVANISIFEGEVAQLSVRATSERPLKITLSGWMSSLAKQTGFSDAGNHTVFVEASDGFYTTNTSIIVEVENVLKAPQYTGKFEFEQ